HQKGRTMSIDRRTFLAATLSSGAAACLETTAAAQEAGNGKPARKAGFKLKYAPHFGMFKASAGEDLIDQLKFMADSGFTALEDNGMMGRSPDEQERIAREMQRLGMTMGVFVAYAEFGNRTFVRHDKEVRAMLLARMKAAVEVAKRVNARWTTVVPGQFDLGLEWDYQTANCIDHLKACAEVCGPAELIMVLEPLNPWRDHPGLFLTKIPQAYQICRAVGSPFCKILDDLYHQQITEGNLIPNMDMAWGEIAYFQVGDNPGRKEPTTGEINYRNIFRHIHSKGYQGVIGMEHGNSKPGKEGEQAVIDAYVACDSF
ncbi:MAG: hydroxypyruvate isomerase family protein, partial [Dongiaceae bacterium]